MLNFEKALENVTCIHFLHIGILYLISPVEFLCGIQWKFIQGDVYLDDRVLGSCRPAIVNFVVIQLKNRCRPFWPKKEPSSRYTSRAE